MNDSWRTKQYHIPLPRWFKNGLVIGIWLLAIISIVYWYRMEPVVFTPSAYVKMPSNQQALEDSHKVIKEVLKAPYNAHFGDLTESKVKMEGERVEIRSYVDSQNGFGAMIRKPYYVELRYHENGSFSIERLVFESLDIKNN